MRRTEYEPAAGSTETTPATPFATRYELQAVTEPGRKLVAQAETLAAELAPRAAEFERDGHYPRSVIDRLAETGYLYSPVPEEFGGLGVVSAHDRLVAATRLARAEPSVTIGTNMHLAVVSTLARGYRAAKAAGRDEMAQAAGATMARFIANKTAVATLVSEANQDLTQPATTAEARGDGWVLNGRKIFGTMAPHADLYSVAVTRRAEDGTPIYGFALVPKGTPGVTLNGDWDPIGMRASDSGSVTFSDCWIPASALRDLAPAGTMTTALQERYLVPPLAHASAPLGIAEFAHGHVLSALASRGPDARGRRAIDRATIQQLAAENTVDLGAARAIFARAALAIDAYFARFAPDTAPVEEAHAISAEANAAKLFVTHAAMRVVERAMTMSGGAGYMNGNPLARAYRDVRAGPFMHPMAAHVAYEYVGQVTLGKAPEAF